MSQNNPEQTPSSPLEINNEAPNYGAQGTFYGPVSFVMPKGHSVTKRGNRGADFDYLQVMFEKYPRYPVLNFSVINSSEQPIQITSIRVVKAVSMKDEHELVRHLLGPRTKLEFSLRDSPRGTWVQAFGGTVVSNLNAGEAEAFQLELDCENTINLLDLEIEFLSSGLEQAGVYISPDMIVVHSPLPSLNAHGRSANGNITVIPRRQAFQALVDEIALNLWRREVYADCTAWQDLFLRGAGYLCRDSLEDGWNILRSKFEGSMAWGAVLASFAELLDQPNFPSTISDYLLSWIHDPQKIMSVPIWDEEVHARVAFEKVVGTTQGKSKERFCLQVLESTLCVLGIIDMSDSNSQAKGACILSLTHMRGSALQNLIAMHGVGCVEYLLSVLFMQAADTAYCDMLLSDLLHQDTTNVKYQDQRLIEFWQDWWHKQTLRENYTTLHWREDSPRLLNALNALNSTELGVISLLATDVDPVIRVAVARNPATPPAVLKILAIDQIPRIRSAVAKHPNTPLEVLRVFAFDDYSSIRSWAASHPNAVPDLLVLLSKDQSWHVQHAVAGNKNCPREVLLMLSKSDVPAVKNTARERLE